MNIAPSAFDALNTTDPRPTALVIGTGFGGLAAAIRLGAKGYRVHMLEKLDALKADSAETQLLFQTHPSPMQRLDRLTLAITPQVEGAAAATSIPLYRGEP